MSWIDARLAEFHRWLAEHPDVGCDALPRSAPEVQYLDFMLRFSGVDENACIAAAAKALEIIAHGLETHIRCLPCTEAWEELIAGETNFAGYVRFTVSNREGRWHIAVPTQDVPLGALSVGT